MTLIPTPPRTHPPYTASLHGPCPYAQVLRTMFESLVDPILTFSRKNCCKIMWPVSDMTIVAGLLRLLRIFLNDVGHDGEQDHDTERMQQMWVEGWFLFSLLWSVGGIVDYEGRQKLDKWLKTEVGLSESAATAKKRKEGDAPARHKFLTQWPEKRMLYDYMYSKEVCAVQAIALRGGGGGGKGQRPKKSSCTGGIWSRQDLGRQNLAQRKCAK